MYMESLLLSQNILFGLSITFLFVYIFNYKLHVGFGVTHSSITKSLFIFYFCGCVCAKGGGQTFVGGGGGGGEEDSIAMPPRPHIVMPLVNHILCFCLKQYT